MKLTNLAQLTQRHKRLAYTMIAVALAPLAAKATCACFSHPEVEINAKIISASMNPEKLEPPLTRTVCGTDLYFQQEADVAVFTKVAEELERDGYERRSQGLPPRSVEEIKAKAMAGFQEEWRAAVKRVTEPKELKTPRFLSFKFFRRVKK